MKLWHLAVPLGLLAAPRVILHDLDLVREGSVINALLVFVPLLIWIVVAVLRDDRPFGTLLAAGGVYGVCLALVHNILWSRAFGDAPPFLGGNLEGRLSAGAEELLLRGAMSLTSLFTGLAVGAICGALAWALTRLRRRLLTPPLTARPGSWIPGVTPPDAGSALGDPAGQVRSPDGCVRRAVPAAGCPPGGGLPAGCPLGGGLAAGCPPGGGLAAGCPPGGGLPRGGARRAVTLLRG